MLLVLTICALVLYQFLYVKLNKKFKISFKWSMVCLTLSVGLSVHFAICCNPMEISDLFLSLVFVILFNLSVTDCKYYEISNISYLFLIPPSIAYMLSNNLFIWYEGALSCLLMFILILIASKLSKGDIGGADIKLLLITSLMFGVKNMLYYTFGVFLFDAIIYVVLLVVSKIKNKNEQIKIPMILAITIACVVLTILTKFL